MTDQTALAVADPSPTSPMRMTVLVSLDRHPAAVYLARLDVGSRPTMRRALDTIASILSDGRSDALGLDWSALRYQHTTAVRTALAERYAPATVNKHLAALRGVLREAWRLGAMDAETYRRASDLPNVSGSTLPAGRALSSGELRALFAVCAEDDRASGPRDAALLALLYGAGLRRSEAVALERSGYDPETGSVTVRRGKGRKDRVTYLANGGKDALAAWCAIRGDGPGPLLWPVDKAGRIQPRRMTAQAVYEAAHRRAARAGIGALSPHDLRRSFVSDLLDSGADLSTVKELAGHASVTTTARYDRRGEGTKRKAANMLHVPYSSRRG